MLKHLLAIICSDNLLQTINNQQSKSIVMKKITSLLIVCATFGTKSYCQEEVDSIAEKKELKHEITIDMLPVFNYSFDDADNDFYLMYKYKIKNSKLRFSLASFSDISTQTGRNYLSSPGYYTVTYINKKTTLSTIKLGIERSAGGKLINFIYGADMLFGVAKSYSGDLNPSTVLDAPLNRFFGDGNYYGSDNSQTSNLVAGLSPFIGVNLNITDNVGLGALITTDCYYKFGEKTFNVYPNFHLTLNVKF